MKYLLIGMLLLTSCTSKTEYGDCIGAFDEKDPTKIYRVSVWNLFWGIVGIELIAPPIFVIVDQTLCPTGLKK